MDQPISNGEIEYNIDNVDELGAMMHALSKPEKIQAYDLFAQGFDPDEVVEEVGVSNSTAYNYREEFQSNGWMDRNGELTEEGEFVYDLLHNLDDDYGEFLYQQAVEEFQDLTGGDLEESDIEGPEDLP